MKNYIRKTCLLAAPAGVSLLTLSAAHAQTYTWDQQALGQEYLHCYNVAPYYWPNNGNWTQAYATNSNCDGSAIITSAPSNWDPTPPVGLYPGGPGLQGVNVIIGGLVNGTNIAGGANTYLQGSATVNNLTLQTNGSLNLGYITSLTATNVDIQGDTIIGPGSYAGELQIAAGGSLTKSGGTGVLGFGVDQYGNPVGLQAVNASLVVESGTFAMPYNGAGYWFGGTFSVSNNATVILNVANHSECTLGDYITGVGGGTVVMTDIVNTGPGLTLDFPGNMFQCSGGYFYGGNPVTNAGVLNLSSGSGLQTPLYNNGTVNLADNSSFGLSGGGGDIIYNNAGGIFNIQGNSSITGSGQAIINSGLFLKSAGAGAAQITQVFESYGGTIEADSGILDMNVNGAGYYTNTTFVVSNGAAIDFLTNNSTMEIEGNLTGTGGGTFLMNNGTVFSYNNATLNFPGAMFQWQGGSLGGNRPYSGYQPLNNAGTLNVSGPVAIDGSIANNGAMIQSGAGGIGGGDALFNQAGAVYDIQNDNGLSVGSIYNYGLIKKSAGTGTSVIAGNLGNYGTNVPLEVDSGTLALSGNGASYFTNATLVISNGATLDFEAVYSPNVATEIEGYLNGLGGGTFLVTNGTIDCRWGTTLNFPGAMFQWAGGSIGSQYNNLSNIGTLNVSGPANVQSYLDNSGIMIQSGAGSISGNYLYNNAGGVYDIQNDNGMSLNAIYNYGLFEKTSGTGTSVITANVGNWGQIQAASGSLFFTNATLVQNAGTLQLSASLVCEDTLQVNGGLTTGVGTVGDPSLDVSMTVNGGVLAPGNPFGTLTSAGHYGFSMGSAATLSVVLGGTNQFSQLAVIGGDMNLNGTLNVTLTNGYTPAIGTQFQIVNGTPGSGFATLNVPQGISVNYSNTGVYLIVTGAVPAQVVSPQVSGGNFTFNFGTVNGQSYTIQQNTNLAAPNWTFYTNFIGNGLPYQLILPVTGAPGTYFRVREP
jgi:hypothetical protein